MKPVRETVLVLGCVLVVAGVGQFDVRAGAITLGALMIAGALVGIRNHVE